MRWVQKVQSALAASKEEVQTLAQAVENKDIALQQKDHKLGPSQSLCISATHST